MKKILILFIFALISSTSFAGTDGIVASDFETIDWRTIDPGLNGSNGIYDVRWCDIAPSPSAWVDTNSADWIMMVYGQDEQPARTVADVFGQTDQYTLENASGTEPPNWSGGKAYFWSNPSMANTNVPLQLGSSFSNISIYCWLEIDAGAAGGVNGIDELDGGQPEYGAAIDSSKLDIRIAQLYPGLAAGAATTNMVLYGGTYDGLTQINYIDGIEQGTKSTSHILDASVPHKYVIGETKGGRPIEGRIAGSAIYGRTITSNEMLTVATAGFNGLAVDTISTNGLLQMITWTNDTTRWADMSGNWANPYPSANYGNTLTRVIVGTNANGVVQYGWDCDGVDDRAEITLNRSPVGSALTMGTNDFLQSCWVYLRVNNQDDVIAGITPFNSNGYGLTLENVNSKWEFSIATSGTNFVADSDSVATMSNWVHVAGWRNAGTMTLYLDGVAQTNTANIGANNIVLTTGSPFTIGGGNGTVIDGILCDPARIYISDNITEAFIGELYTNTGPTSIETRIDNR